MVSNKPLLPQYLSRDHSVGRTFALLNQLFPRALEDDPNIRSVSRQWFTLAMFLDTS